VACFLHAKRISGQDETDESSILEMMHENGRKQYEGKEHMRAQSVSPCQDNDKAILLRIVWHIKLLIRKTYQHSGGTEHVAEWIIYQVEEGSCIQVSIPHNLGGEESLARSTPK
jgi:hypothetical protein